MTTRKRTRPTQPVPVPPRAPARPAFTIIWNCCGVLFDSTPALIEHLWRHHKLNSFLGTQIPQSANVYQCRIGNLTLTKTVELDQP